MTPELFYVASMGDPCAEDILAQYPDLLVRKARKHWAEVYMWVGYADLLKAMYPHFAIARAKSTTPQTNNNMWWRNAGQEKVLYVMRGMPGSGKSTKARQIGEGGAVFGTDDFWGPDYDFDPDRLGEAHSWNEARAIAAMDDGVSPIVIDNVNVRPEHAGNYARAGRERGYRIEVVEPDTPWAFDLDELERRNTHSVPRQILEEMRADWAPNFTVDDLLAAHVDET